MQDQRTASDPFWYEKENEIQSIFI
jgi:hypothetical protein